MRLLTRKKALRRVLPLLVGGLLLLPMFRWFEHHQVYHPYRTMEATGGELGRPFEDVWFAAADGVRLNGWFYAAAPDSPRRDYVILLCHGNAGNISHRLAHARLLLDTGCSLFLFDYRGYGRSEGRPSETGTYQDAEAAGDWLEQRGLPRGRILLVGESLGGGVASEIAHRKPVGGLVLLSSFTSVPDLGADLFPWLPVRWLSRIRYDTRSKLPEIRVPVLILHSRADRLVGFHHAEANLAAANPPKELVELEGDHNDFLEVSEGTYREALGRFLGRIASTLQTARETR